MPPFINRISGAELSSRASLLLAFILVLAALPAGAVAIVPPGNRNLEQPPVPGASARRTQALATTYEAKYRKIRDLLRSDQSLVADITRTATQYEIEPIHIIGAIVGEHTYNVDAYDRLQTYYVKAISYIRSSFGFSFGGESVTDFVQRPQFAPCNGLHDSYDLWSCRKRVWEERFRGRIVDGKRFPDDRFDSVFFQPFYAGQTFGIGQLNPLTALQMTDLVHEVSGFPRLDPADPQGVYHAIMDPHITLAYIAATLKKAITAYRKIAGFDISQNPGITATLYNLGDPEARARKLAAENRLRRKKGLPAKLPEENYYGWLVNERLNELRAVLPTQ